MGFLQNINKCMRWMCPYGIIRTRRKILTERHYRSDKKANEIRNYFLSLNRDEQSIEILEIIDFFEEHSFFTSFPYEFANRYYYKNIAAFYDSSDRMFFVLHQGKKMYFPRGWNKDNAASYYKGLCLEQDAASPHRYETKEFIPGEGNVIADIGWRKVCGL